MELIEHKKYTFKVYPEKAYLEYIIKEGVLIDAADATEGKKMITDRWPDIKFYVLVQGIGFFTLTREARALSSSKKFGDNTKAVAFYTINDTLLALSKMYLKIDRPHVPTKFFRDINEARFWLDQQIQKDQGKSLGGR